MRIGNYNAFRVGRKVAIHARTCLEENCKYHEAMLTKGQIQKALKGKLHKIGHDGVSYSVGYGRGTVEVGCQRVRLSSVKRLLSLFP